MANSQNYWIFQSVVDRFDLRKETNFHTGMSIRWDATRYRSKMKAGDLLYFWMGGPSDVRGIYGWGHLTSTPDLVSGEWKVEVLVDHRLENFVHVKRVRAIPSADYLMILNIAIGSNFYINRREAREIAMLIPHTERPEIP